jgi:glycosyltransferase involved in cell wall biosynthesis
MSHILVSIVVPLFNKEKEIGRAVGSIQKQTVREFEVIVVNDGSTDKGPEIIRSIEELRIRVIDQTNQGVSAARNRGIAEAQSDLIAFLDADDEWAPDYLDTVMRLARAYPEASIYATSYYYCRGNVKRPAVIRSLPGSFIEGILDNYFLVASHSDPPLWTSAVAVRKNAIEAVGGFPVGVIAGEDLLTWARLAVRNKIAYCRKPKAAFYAPGRMTDRPERHPQIPDRVAAGFIELLHDDALPSEARNGLSLYIGLWHRMRAVVFIKLNKGAEARREICASKRYGEVSLRSVLLYVLSLLPRGLMAKSYYALNWFRYAVNDGK